MDVVGIIPARLDSTRLEAKVLKPICGKPMIQHVWERARACGKLEDLWVATDDERVAKAVESFGGKAIFTAKEHRSGTDRVREASHSVDARIIVNIQGDEPLVQHSMIDLLVDPLLDSSAASMTTLIKRIEDPKDLANPNVVKVVVDRQGFALYFSRSPIPYFRNQGAQTPLYKHLGLYAYTKDFLLAFSSWKPSPLEQAEGLEQLRVLEHGQKILTVETSFDTVAVDTVEDLARVEEILREEAKRQA